MRNNYVRTLPIFFAVFLALSAAVKPAQACGGGDESYHYFNLFVPEWLFDQEYQPTFYTAHDYHHIWAEPDYANANLQSWKRFLGEGPSDELLEKILYNRYVPGYSDVPRTTLVKSVLFDGSLLPIAKQEAVKAYLLLSLRLEQMSNPPDPWRREQENLTTAAQEAIVAELKEAYEREKLPYLKNRYAFQLLKAYRYSGQREPAMALYEAHFAEAKDWGLIDYWAMDHYAGLLLEKGEEAEGMYHFLKVFQECPSRRHSAYYSFQIDDQRLWDKTYELCASSEEKALMHFVRGTKQDVLALEDMRAIRGLLGNHQWLKVVTARELNKLEADNFDYYQQQPIESLLNNLKQRGSLLKNESYDDYAGQLLQFVSTAYYNNRKDGFWQVAKAYLEMMTGKVTTAKITLQEGGELQAPYKRIKRELELAIMLLESEKISPEQHDFIAEEIVSIFGDDKTELYSHRNNQEFILDLLAYRLREQNEEVLAGLLNRRMIWETKTNPAMVEVEGLLELANQPQHSKLELLALKHFVGNDKSWKAFLLNSTNALQQINYQLLDIKAHLLMRDPEQLEAAAAIFDSLSPEFDYQLEHNPFNGQIVDCVHDPACQGSTSATYTRNSFVRKLVDIQDIAERESSAMDYYLLGNAYYNMTYFGPAYYVMNYYRSGAAYDGFTDCEVALNFYKKAMNLATDRELAAKACYMAAKAQQNLYFVRKAEEEQADYWYKKYVISDWGSNSDSYDTFQADIKAAGYRAYFDKLEREYGQTRFYQRAVRECKYLEYYVNRW
jgi:hypothetical protein